MEVAYVVQDVHHESTIASSKLVYNEIVIRVVGQFIVLDEIARDSFAVIWLE